MANGKGVAVMFNAIRIYFLQRRYERAAAAESAYNSNRDSWHVRVALAYERRANVAACALAAAIFRDAIR